MSTLLKEITLSDVVCELDNGKKFQLYKSILAARSPVFKAMFTSNKFKVPGISVEAFEDALRYFYTDQVTNRSKFALELFEFADKVLQISTTTNKIYFHFILLIAVPNVFLEVDL